MNSSNFVQKLVRAAPMIFVLLWSTGYLCGRLLRPYVDPMTFSATRFAIASGLLILIVLMRGTAWPKKFTDWAHLAVTGVLIHGLFIAGMMYAVNVGIEMGLAALIGGCQPILTALIAVNFLGDRLNNTQKFGFLLGFVGLAMVVFKSLSVGNVPIHGLIVAIVGLFGITLGTLYQKRFVPAVDLWAGSAIQFAAALVPVGLYALFFEAGHIEWNTTVILTTAWLVLVQSIGAIIILFYLIRAGAVSKVSSLFYLVPPVCALEGYLIFNEQLTAIQFAGIAVVTLGVAMINRQVSSADP